MNVLETVIMSHQLRWTSHFFTTWTHHLLSCHWCDFPTRNQGWLFQKHYQISALFSLKSLRESVLPVWLSACIVAAGKHSNSSLWFYHSVFHSQYQSKTLYTQRKERTRKESENNEKIPPNSWVLDQNKPVVTSSLSKGFTYCQSLKNTNNHDSHLWWLMKMNAENVEILLYFRKN